MENKRQLTDKVWLIEQLQLLAKYEDNFRQSVILGVVHTIRNAPTVDAVEVVHGRWEQARYTEAPLYICSQCGKPEYKQHNYCPNCGARMDGDM